MRVSSMRSTILPTLILTTALLATFASPAMGALTPEDLRDAYNLPNEGGDGVTVAVAIALDAPTAEEDLAVYRETYELPPCTTENGCFTKVQVNEEGEEVELEPSKSWAEEAALDLDMVSATCPECDILFVEGTSTHAAVVEAVARGADVVSGSFAFGGDFAWTADEEFFAEHPEVQFVFATGDNGYEVNYPASSAHTIAVGGTRLKEDKGSPRGWSETAWEGTGSGCSAYIEKPAWQSDEACGNRALADVSAVSKPGVSVYHTYQQSSPWHSWSGTSASAPIVAGILALSEERFRAMGPRAFHLLGEAGGFFDPVEGINGSCGNYLCEAGPGYDGPTGWGTPDGPFVLPVAVTEEVTVASEAEATLYGSIHPKEIETEYRFEYGTSPSSYESTTSYKSLEAGDEYVEVEEPIEGLEGLTTYYYRVTAVNSEGTFHGVERTFGTTPPSATTGSESEVEFDGNGAALPGSVNPQGSETSYWFEYGLSEEYGSKAPWLPPGGAGSGAEAVELSEVVGPLLPDETYHFRLVAENTAATAYGEDETLTTPPPEWVAELPSIAKAQGLTAISCPALDDCIVLDNRSGGAGAWRLQDGEWSALPDVPKRANLGLSCTSITRCVAVGFDPEGQAFVAEWDGKEWQLPSVPLPPEVSGASRLESVSCASAVSCTAVGWFIDYYSGTGKSGHYFPKLLVERWDGEEWSYEPPLESTYPWGRLESVSCTSSSFCVAAGYYETIVGDWRAFALRWDGSEWSSEASTDLDGGEKPHFSGVSCASADACTAVGTSKGAGGYFADRWDGEAWTLEFLPAIGSDSVSDGLVSCSSGYFCAIAGVGIAGAAPSTKWPVAFSWHGSDWSEQSASTPEVGEEYLSLEALRDLECTSATWCTAAGYAKGSNPMTETYSLTPVSPTATTEAASNLTGTTATLNGIVNPNGEATEYYFEYGPTDSYGSETGKVEVPSTGTEDVEVSQKIVGLDLGVRYHYHLVAESGAGAAEGEDETFTTIPRDPALNPPGGSFPASFSLQGEEKVLLRGSSGATPLLTCSGESEVPALEGEGQFSDATSGTATLTLHECHTVFNLPCTTSGQSERTIVTEALPFRLVYLSDGEPGVVFLPEAESGRLLTATCSFVGEVEVSGSGVLGRITDPGLGEPSETLTIDLNAPEVGEEEWAQEYTETAAGTEYGLLESVGGGEAQPATLEAEPTASFEGEGELVEPELALNPPGGSFPASFSLQGEEEVRLRGSSSATPPLTCSGESEVPALEGEGQFSDATSGTATLTLHECHTVFNLPCTTSGQSERTIVTEALPFRLVYLSDGEPGVVFLPEAESGRLLTATCSFVGEVEVSGSGVLGQITDPGLGEPSETLTIDLNAPEVGEEEWAQEYTETAAGTEYGLLESVGGGEAQPATLEAEPTASFEGEGELVEE